MKTFEVTVREKRLYETVYLVKAPDEATARSGFNLVECHELMSEFIESLEDEVVQVKEGLGDE